MSIPQSPKLWTSLKTKACLFPPLPAAVQGKVWPCLLSSPHREVLFHTTEILCGSWEGWQGSSLALVIGWCLTPWSQQVLQAGSSSLVPWRGLRSCPSPSWWDLSCCSLCWRGIIPSLPGTMRYSSSVAFLTLALKALWGWRQRPLQEDSPVCKPCLKRNELGISSRDFKKRIGNGNGTYKKTFLLHGSVARGLWAWRSILKRKSLLEKKGQQKIRACSAMDLKHQPQKSGRRPTQWLLISAITLLPNTWLSTEYHPISRPNPCPLTEG